ncbi:hypothetical protein PINS_up002281 [Pythium insidiosum]|nr:hypothetical protein PINS_up002281 [Pythium insidiosum]
MSVSIKVSVRCRPFTCDDQLGVLLTQTSDEEGEVQLLNSTYSTTRFAFSYAWWSAYGYQRHVVGSPPEADQMTLIDQNAAYSSVGVKIKEDLLAGNAVVLFAYGLSGSGKTFTVFGPDAVDIPEAWFKHEEPHALWGIFPRLAYELFREKQDGWKISMKYFQNVVDTVRDLMSPVAQEQQYKSGMKKDADGFMDIEWCQSVVLKDWNDLRRTFMAANARKAIAPTQFNHQSTRGHCIMTLEVEKPDPERDGMKQRGRVYVCDLAGTEPAGDIVYAEYKKVVFENGDIEHKYLGPHPDAAKSKELQDQGKKINLSLTEMAQFFMKMAEAVKANKLKPGMSIPGCNSYFLCKYLKDTMLQARTYLFCAIRPEVKFHNYTFSTLGFAKNASVIKLQPKKATTAASAAERKLMAELEQMKLLVSQLKAENERMAKLRAGSSAGGASSAGGDGEDDSQVDQLSALLAQKQRELERVLSGEAGDDDDGDSDVATKPRKRNPQDEFMARQREEYGKRGISLAHFESETTAPYLINLDVDAYRSRRFMFLLTRPRTTIGPSGDIQPMSLTVVDDHCAFENDGAGVITLVVGQGDVIHNGTRLARGARVELTVFDRVVLGNELLLFVYPGKEPEGQEPPSADDAAKEYQRALQSASAATSGGAGASSTAGDNAAMLELQQQLKKFEEEKANWERQKAELAASSSTATTSASGPSDEEAARLAAKERELLARQVNDQELREVLPKIVELKQIVKALNRDMLSFETALQSATTGESSSSSDSSNPSTTTATPSAATIPKVKVKVRNEATDETIFLDVFEFVKAHALLKDEVAFLRNAIMNDRDYEAPAGHDPITLLFDNSFHVGSATAFPEYLLYNLETEPEEAPLSVKLAVPPFNTIGKLEVVWTPLSSPELDKHRADDVEDVENPEDLVGKPWTYRLQIKGATGLPLITDLAYVQYEFLGELFTTESVEQNTRKPRVQLRDGAPRPRRDAGVRRVALAGAHRVPDLCEPAHHGPAQGPYLEPQPRDRRAARRPKQAQAHVRR